ncbi:DUF6011 domain-containing protein [Mycolicibacterium hippocampi]|uniref:DUF6011 domain-containing protein n=1 Tax=Mycolicibacterium hippocampi TaxID=659824 RepID=UPI003512C594
MARSRKPAPPQDRPSRNTTNVAQSTATDGSESDFDRKIVDRVDESLWQALFDGHFRLGVKCERCGRWLYDGRSKKRGLGAHCAAKAVGE